MNLAQLLVRTARVSPERPAIHLGARCLWTYGELANRSARIAAFLRSSAQLVAGDRVAVFMSNCPEYLEVLYGAWWAGLVVVPVNAKLHAREALFIVQDSEAAAVFVSDDLAGELLPLIGEAPSVTGLIRSGSPEYLEMFESEPLAPQHRAPDDVAWLFYTSGTTGRPKGVMQTHRNLLTMTACYFADVDDVSPDDAIVYAAPMSHGAGLYNFMHVLKGARHVVPASGGFDPAELVELAENVGRLSMFAAPTMVKRLVDHVIASGASVSGFKTIVYGGGPMYVSDIRRALEVMGDRFVQIFGQGESPMTITALSRVQLADRTHPRWGERIASVGVAQSMVEVRVVDEYGNTLPSDATGEVVVRGDAVMAGYWRNPDATSQAIRDGWLWTGDVGAMDAEGFLTLKDRSKDVIISGGSNIYPREIEEVLLRHPGVREVSVIGQPDPEWGEIVVAFIAGDASSDELDALCLEHIARFKRPKQYRFVAALPKNNYGKILKTALRALLDAQGGDTEENR
jgi:long-chain acyl-CoA synthetase